MSQQPLVSVIMPFYNGHDHIVESVKSVITQTYRNFELIIVNDGSRAPSPKELLSRFDCSQIRFIDHEHNKGLAAARNTAYEAVAGEFMVPLDCDDMIAPSFLAETVDVLMKNPDVDAVYTQVRIFGEVNLDWVPDATMINLMAGLPIPSTVVYRKPVFERVGGYNTSIKYVPDVDFWIRALSKGVRLQRVEKPLYHYRKHTNSLSDVGQLTEVQVLAEANKNLYQTNMSAVLSALEQKHFQDKSEYAKLEAGFKEMETGYEDLLRRYNDVVAQLRKRSVRYQLQKLMPFVRQK